MTSIKAEKTFYITTPIYYVNDQPHIGAATTNTICDVLARYHRLRGKPTWFITGTDENASKVQEAAAKAGIPTKQFVDGLAAAFSEAWQRLHISYDDFYRTTEPRHKRAVQDFVRILIEKGYVYKAVYEGWYSVSDETFFRDSEVDNGIAIETGKKVTRIQEENYFFRLSAFEDRLLNYIETHPDFLLPVFRKNEVVAFIKDGLHDVSITRTNRGWGITLPDDATRIVYVWFDALINYLAATGWPDAPDWDQLWPADAHVVGKEIFVRFHATLWPAMLMALDLPVPRQVYAHGFWTIRGQKGGKTGPRLPHPTRFTELIATRSGIPFEIAADSLRYLLCREMNFSHDTEFSIENFLRRFNNDLSNDLGNLLNRTLSMTVKYRGGVIPSSTKKNSEISILALQIQEEYAKAMNEYRFNAALEAVWQLVSRMNKLIDEVAPWKLVKAISDEVACQKLNDLLYDCLEVLRLISILITPFMPVVANEVRRQLGLTQSVYGIQWGDLRWGDLSAGTKIGTPEPLFPRMTNLIADEEAIRLLNLPPSTSRE